MKTRLLYVTLTASVLFASLGAELSSWLDTWSDGV
jgi:hypothetical protein